MVNKLDEQQKKLAIQNNNQVNINKEIANLRELVEYLKSEFEQHRTVTEKNLGDLNMISPTKADKMEITDLEKRFKEIIDDILKQILELIPNRSDI